MRNKKVVVAGREWKSSGEVVREYEFQCDGPSQISVGRPPRSVLGTMMTVERCMLYADCTCGNYLKAVDLMERVEAEIEG